MLIVGELINATRKAIMEAIEAGDWSAIQKVAKDQAEAGADYIDVNAGGFVGREPEILKQLVATVQEAAESPCCIDSSDPKALETALSVHKGAAMINSISFEKSRYEEMLPLLAGTDLKIVALCMSDEGMPQSCAERVGVAEKLINGLVRNGMPIGNIYVDLLVQPVSTRDSFGVEFLEAVHEIMTRFEGVHTICGLSNISYGLPERKFVNRTFAAMAVAKGLDSLIVNPLDRRMMASLLAAEMLSGKDEYCKEYIRAYRAKKLEGV